MIRILLSITQGKLGLIGGHKHIVTLSEQESRKGKKDGVAGL